MNRRRLAGAGAGLALFAIWTLIVGYGISHGSRASVQTSSTFGSWPSRMTHVDRSFDIHLSIFATYAPTGSSASGTAPDLIGQATIGSRVDRRDGRAISGTRFTTGRRAGAVTSVSVFVAGPVQAAPRDQFQLAIYDDARGAPSHHIAQSVSGVLTADAWNTLDVDAVLQPKTAYWLMYSTNASKRTMNNTTVTPVSGHPLDGAIRAYRSAELHDVATGVTCLGNMLPTGAAVVVVSVLAGRRRRLFGAALLGGLVVALLIALALREITFAPYGLYPSGHALRTCYLAVIAAFVVPRCAVRIAGGCLVLFVSVAAVYVGGHYTDEIIGGLLLGGSVAVTATAFAPHRGRASSNSATPRA